MDSRASEKYDYIFKIVIIGNGSCGKSSILHYYINNKIKKNMSQTVGVEFASKMITIEDKVIKLQLWDTAGQERYRSVARTYYRGALGAIVVFDLTSTESYAAVPQWIRDAKDFGRSDINILPVGNKLDLLVINDCVYVVKDQRKINSANKVFEAQGLDYYETSAMTGENVEDVFICLASIILKRIENGSIDKDDLRPRLMNPVHRFARLTKDTEETEIQKNNQQCYC